MPDHTYASVARLSARLSRRFVSTSNFSDPVSFSHSRCAQRLLDSDIYRVKLVVAGHLLSDRSAAGILEDDEVPNEIEKAPLIEDTLDYDLKFWKVGIGESFAGDRAPRLKPLPACRERADPGLNSVRDQQRLVVCE